MAPATGRRTSGRAGTRRGPVEEGNGVERASSAHESLRASAALEPLVIWVSDPNVGPEAEGIDGFYRTSDSAVRGVKGRFGEPYRVRWSEHGTSPRGALLLRGEFEAVTGYCTSHVAEWFILPVTVEP